MKKVLFPIVALVLAVGLAVPMAAAAQDGDGICACEVVSWHQGTEKDGDAVQTSRSDETNALGPPNASGPPWVNFFSLGFDSTNPGEIVLEFCSLVGGELTVYECSPVTGAGYPLETADVYGSLDGVIWTFLGTAQNNVSDTSVQHPSVIDLGENCILYVKIVDTTNPGDHTGNADAFDVDAVCAEYECVQCIPPPSGMVSWWPGDGDASDIADGNDGTLQNGATFAAGKVGQAFSFDGSDDYVSVADSASLDISGAITVEAWVNVSSYTSGKVYTIAGKWNDKDGDYRAYLLALSTKETGSPLPKFYISSTGTNFDSAVWTQALSTGTWYHLAGTFDGDVLKIYVDGVEKGSNDTTLSSIALNDQPLLIAGDRAGGTGNAYFNGLIDEVEIFNRALSASEIQAIYNAGSAGKCKVVPPVEVDIDIKPGSDPNSINLGSKGVVPVAILGSADFDASTVDPSTIMLAGASARFKGKSGNAGSLEDVNSDGYLDLVVQVYTIDFAPGDGTAELTGETYDGVPIHGTDSIRIVPPE